MKNTRHSKGFTLIELLIVITIIGILAVALLPSVLGAPARARDAARKADLNNIIAALETYNSDNQDYPDSTADQCVNAAGLGLNAYFQGGAAPNDPQGKGVGSCATGYFYCKLSGSPSSYLVSAQMEVAGDANSEDADLSALVCDGTEAAPTLTDPPVSDPKVFTVLK